MRWIAAASGVLMIGLVQASTGAGAQAGPGASAVLEDAPAPQVAGSGGGQSAAAGAKAPSTQEKPADHQSKPDDQKRVFGVLPSFGIENNHNAPSLSGGQKMRLAFRSAIDPSTFALAAIAAGYHQANQDQRAYGLGVEGYSKRFGAAYADSFDGRMLGMGLLPVLLHQDPRYFRRGHGSGMRRAMYALASTVICKHDNTGKWEPNYSNVGGTLAAGAISNVYYPPEDSGMGQTFMNTGIVLAEYAVGSVFDEFWLDVSRKVLHKDPTGGADSRAKARHRAAHTD